jgi:diguanylate cyclase (GGDEF)-like protein
MEKVLIVEDSKVFARVLIRKIEDELFFDTSWASTFEETVYILEESPERPDFFVAVVDLHLPDSEDGSSTVDYLVAKGIPVIVYTGAFNEEHRDAIWSKRVVDYVLKETPDSLNYVTSLVKRIYKNKYTSIMVVDDSATLRRHVRRLLEVHDFSVLEATDGEEALRLLSRTPSVRLVVTEYHMPGMDGLELTRTIRRDHRKEDLAIIGVSASSEDLLSSRFLKFGANDYLCKPFASEEFYCRITQSLETLELVRKLKEASIRDPLTGLYNRRYFFDAGNKFHSCALRDTMTLAVAMIDIDFFKKVNDTHGHKAGDEVLKHVAEGLSGRFRGSDIVARYGGEEFCVLAVNMGREAALTVFDELRRSIERSRTRVDNTSISVTVSIGVCCDPHKSLEEMLAKADGMLYQCKRSGRNRVMLAS